MSDVDLDFEQLLFKAVAREAENLDGDDSEGYPFEVVLPRLINRRFRNSIVARSIKTLKIPKYLRR